MPNNYNAMARAHRHMAQLLNQQDTDQTLIVWMKHFNISESSPIVAIEVARKIGLLYDQLTQARVLACQTTIDPASYQPIFDLAIKSLDITKLANQWSESGRFITPQVVSVFALLSDILPSDEEKFQILTFLKH